MKWRRVIAALAGAELVATVVALVSPLSLTPAGREAAPAVLRDLDAYRAAPVDLREAPLVSQAAAAYEDRALFTRPGWVPPISLRGVVRAIGRNLRGIPEGGSTIPQQLAKLYLRGAHRATLADKSRELLLATWIVRQATPSEIAGLYLNLSAGASLGDERRPVDGLDRLSLALFGLPLKRLSREDQLVLGASPRGVGWLRTHPAISAQRLAAARDWLANHGQWDTSARSFLDDIDPASAFRFVDGWTEQVASGGADIDLVSAIDRFREGLGGAIDSGFPGTAVRTALAVIAGGGVVLARSGAEAALMPVNYGSIAKLEALDFAVEAFGPHAVQELSLPPAPCVRWIWATKDQRRARAASWCPNDVAPAARPMPFDEAVARSINSLTARHALLLPVLFAERRPDLLAEISQDLSAEERAALDSPADKALTAALFAQLGQTVQPDEIASDLSYSAASVALFRHLAKRRLEAGLPAAMLPEDPTSLLGNSSRATAEQIGAYLHHKLFAGDGSCTLSDTGALLGLHRKEGTLRWLAQRWPKLVFSGKTGSSPHDDSAVAAVALCLDARPVVIVAALRALSGPLPEGLHGSVLLRGIDAYLKQLGKLERKPSSALWPPFVLDETPPEEAKG
jgi:hypothetical protein